MVGGAKPACARRHRRVIGTAVHKAPPFPGTGVSSGRRCAYSTRPSGRSLWKIRPNARADALRGPVHQSQMSRRTIFLLALASLVACMAAVVPWRVATEPMAAQIAHQFRKTAGLHFAVEGRATFALLPVPRVKFEDIALRSPDGDVRIEAQQLRGELRLLPLLAGRLELTDVVFIEPQIHAAASDDRPPLSLIADRLLQEIARTRTSGHGLHLSRMVIRDGTVTVQGGASAPALRADRVNLVINWPDTEREFAVAGSVDWRGQTVGITMSDLVPAVVTAGGTSPLTLTLKAPLATLDAQGEVTGSGAQQFSGRLRFASRSVREMTRWLDMPAPLAPLIEAFAIEGPATLSKRGLSLPSATVTLEGDRLEGAVTARLDGERLSVAGTLAADELALERLLSPLAPARSSEGGWSREPFDPTALTAADLDIRLSATSAHLGRSKLENVAAGILLKGGRLELALGRADAYKGTVKGRLSLVPTATGVEARLQGGFDRVDMQSLLGEAGNMRRLAGSGQGQLTVDAHGSSMADLARSVSGRMSFSVRQGEIIGLNLTEVARRSERRPLSTSLEWQGGRTAFDVFGGSFQVAGGVAEIADGVLTSPGLRGTIAGRIGIVERQLALKGTVAGPSTTASAGGFPFEISGNWDDPLVAPDVQALIQRSGAAAPLLYAPLADAPRPQGLRILDGTKTAP